MRVLIAEDTLSTRPGNPFVVQLVEGLIGLRTIDHVSYGIRPLYWDGAAFDIIHFQWPEALFSWKQPQPDEIEALAERVRRHRKRARIVTTVHNLAPHPAMGDTGETVTTLIYAATDDFIHLSEGARDLFAGKHRATRWWQTARHHVIEHGDYIHYTRLRADDALVRAARESKATRLLLVFGALRSVEEESLPRLALEQAALPDTKLVFAGNINAATLPAAAVKQWREASEPGILRFHRRIPDNQVAPLVGAARFLFVTRADRINSGVIPLAFTFGVPVIAPDSVLSSAVKHVGGPIYKPGDVDAAAAAIAAAFAMDDAAYAALQQRIHAYRRDRMQWPDIARQHFDVYRGSDAATSRGPLARLRRMFQ